MKQIKKNFLKTIPVLTGYIFLGIGFGIILRTKGYGVGWAFAMSLCIYAGSMQYVAVDLLALGAGYLTVALTTLMVNARHLFYGISFIDKYKNTKPYKPYLIFGLTDETYSLICQDDTLTPKDMFEISLFNQIYWITGSLIGSVLGAVIPWDFKGIDFALTALFVCIYTDQWMHQKNHLPAITGVVATLVCLVIFGSQKFLIPSMILITVVLFMVKGFMKRKEEQEKQKERES